jgi:hypothetical protein
MVTNDDMIILKLKNCETKKIAGNKRLYSESVN